MQKIKHVINRLISHDVYLWLTLLLSLPIVSPFLQSGYHWGAHDSRHAVYFLFEFYTSIQDGIWYPRWSPNFAFGYGYPFFNIYAPISSYIGSFFLLLGFDYVDSVKIVFSLSGVISGLTMYLFVRELLDRQAGLIAGLIYVYIPYHLFDIYVRAALAESVGYVLIPLVMWGFYRAMTKPSISSVVWGAVAYAIFMMTHNLAAVLLTPILGVYVAMMLLTNKPDRFMETCQVLTITSNIIKRSIPPALILILGLSLSAIFFLPFIAERQDIRTDQWIEGRYAFGDDFVETFQLLSPHWGFGASIPGPNDDAGFQLGLVPVILFFLSFFVVPKLQNWHVRLTLYFMQGLTLTIIFLLMPISAKVWEVLTLATFAQFPWRLLLLAAPALAIVGSSVVAKPKIKLVEKVEFLNVIPIALLIMLASYPYLTAELRDPKPTEGPVDLAGLFRFQQASDEMTGSTRWVKDIPTWSPLADTVIGGDTIQTRIVESEIWDERDKTPLLGVNSFEIDSVHEFIWVYAADDNQTVTFYIPYYPGWTATIYEDTNPARPDLYPDGRIGKIIAQPEIQTTDREGWIVVPVPKGEHFLELRFDDTPIRIVGKWVSFLTILLMWISLIVSTKITTNGLLLHILDGYCPSNSSN